MLFVEAIAEREGEKKNGHNRCEQFSIGSQTPESCVNASRAGAFCRMCCAGGVNVKWCRSSHGFFFVVFKRTINRYKSFMFRIRVRVVCAGGLCSNAIKVHPFFWKRDFRHAKCFTSITTDYILYIRARVV